MSIFQKKYEITQGDFGPHICLYSGWSRDVEKVIKRKGVLELELNYAKGWPRGSDLSFLADLTQLKSFELLDYKVSDISVINKLSELSSLKINANCNNVIDFPNFPHLQRISIEWFPNAESLFRCYTLRRVFINCCDIKSLSVFEKLGDIEYLSLKSPQLECIGQMNMLNKLVFLGIYNAKNLQSLEGVQQFPNLEMLEIERCKKISNITAVESLKKLRRFMIANCGDIDSLRPLADLRELREVFFHESTNVRDGDLQPLKLLPRLEVVSFQERKHYNLTRKDFGQDYPDDIRELFKYPKKYGI